MWVHNGMIRLDQAKMSKSEGNIFVLSQALEEYGRDTLIMYFCTGHYRQPVEFSAERLDQAAEDVRGIREVARRLVRGPSPAWSAALHEQFFDALAEDFNTPAARAALFQWTREARGASGEVGDADLRDMLGVLGLENLLDVDDVAVPDEVAALVRQRAAARSARDWAEADRLRDAVRQLGWEIMDGPDGADVRPAA
jgi:cysteinyl-tRNA synthetase